MPGLVAVFSETDSTADLEPLIKCVQYRGASRMVAPVNDNCSMAVLGSRTSPGNNAGQTALDGYIIHSGQKETEGHKAISEKQVGAMLKEKGPSCLEKIEGEFTLAYSGEDGDFTVARDPLGVKPLYYVDSGDTFFIAPEIKALVGVEGRIREVPPGSYFDREEGWVSYFSLPLFNGGRKMPLEEAEEKVRHLLKLAVEERISDIADLGVYLSGGLDSSVVAALAAELREEPISTYTVGVAGSRDIEYASAVAERLGSQHHQYTYDLDQILEVLPKVIYHLESFDCAYVRSAIPNYIAARHAAHDRRRVMLTGEGSDELFAGYSYLKNMKSGREIESEIESFMKSLSNTGLQRVDRMNSAHGIECRVPFLKLSLLELVAQFPLEWKLHDRENEPVDKWILRRAFEDELGTRVAWREKEQFDQGSGSAQMLAEVAETEISDDEFEAESQQAPVPVRNKEELYYYRIFRQFYPESVLPLVGRWAKTG